MTNWPILSVVTFLPLVGALIVYISPGDDEAGRRNSRWIALWTTLVTFALSLMVWAAFDPANAGFQLDAQSIGGEIESDFNVNVNNQGNTATARGTVGKGGPDRAKTALAKTHSYSRLTYRTPGRNSAPASDPWPRAR